MLVSDVASILPFALELLLVTMRSPSAVALRFLYISLARKLGINQQLLPLPFSPLPRLPRSVYSFPQSRACPRPRRSLRLASYRRRSDISRRRPLVVPFVIRDLPLPLVVKSHRRMRYLPAKSEEVPHQVRVDPGHVSSSVLSLSDDFPIDMLMITLVHFRPPAFLLFPIFLIF